jgi:hypothetical protein
LSSQNVLLEGNLGAVSLPNLAQLIFLEQKTAALTLNRVELGQTAEMIFRRGELIFAHVNNLVGNEAMYRIVGWWNAGTFKVIELTDEELPEPNISARLDYLLLEGMRRMDANADVRSLVPNLTSAVSFTQSALDSFSWDQADPPEWIPHAVRQLPRSFSVSQLHHVSDMDETRMGGLLKMLLSPQAVRVHTPNANYDDDGFSSYEDGPKSTRYEAFAQLLMEYVGYEQAYGMLDATIYELGWEDIDAVTFSQLIDMADRLSMGLMASVDRKKVIEAQRRLRARATSLV